MALLCLRSVVQIFCSNLQVSKIVSPDWHFGVLASLLFFLIFLVVAGYLHLKSNGQGIECVF